MLTNASTTADDEDFMDLSGLWSDEKVSYY
jgi:hypothetical protein